MKIWLWRGELVRVQQGERVSGVMHFADHSVCEGGEVWEGKGLGKGLPLQGTSALSFCFSSSLRCSFRGARGSQEVAARRRTLGDDAALRHRKFDTRLIKHINFIEVQTGSVNDADVSILLGRSTVQKTQPSE